MNTKNYVLIVVLMIVLLVMGACVAQVQAPAAG